jgi:hypothetical protein
MLFFLEMTSTAMVIQVRYLYPEKISQQNVRDEIEIRFLMPEFIIQEKMGQQVKNETALYRKIPRQLRNDSKDLTLLTI